MSPIWNSKYQQEVVCLHHERGCSVCLFACVLLGLPREEYASWLLWYVLSWALLFQEFSWTKNRPPYLNLALITSPYLQYITIEGTRSRLDRCLVKKSSQNTLHASHQNISDHIPIIFHLLFPEPIPRGSSFWRPNIRRLNDSSALALTDVLRSCFTSHSPVLPQWESIKRQVRDFFLRCDRGLANQRDRVPRLTHHPRLLRRHSRRDSYLVEIKADTTRGLPTPLPSSLIDNNITSNRIPM